MQLEVLGDLKRPVISSGIEPCDLTACSIMLPRSPSLIVYKIMISFFCVDRIFRSKEGYALKDHWPIKEDPYSVELASETVVQHSGMLLLAKGA
jgi:hypothetical protein